jgi:hypothetical protein
MADEDESRQLEDEAKALVGAERELLASIQNFVEAQTRAGGSKGRAFDILRQLLRKAGEEKVRQRRASFRIVD